MTPKVESKVREEFRKEGLVPERWSNGPGAVYGEHTHPYAKVLMVVEGSIEFRLSSRKRIVRMQPGERLDLPAGTLHSALIGPHGVICFEAHRDR